MSKEYDRSVLNSIRRNLFFIVVALVSLGFFYLIEDYLIAVFWAAVLSIIFYGPYVWIAKRLGVRRSLAAALTSTIIFLIVIIPIGLLSLALVKQGGEVVTAINTGELDLAGILDYVNERIPRLESWLADNGITVGNLRVQLSEGALSFSQALGNRMIRYGGNTISFLLQFSLMLYLLFFFLRDGRKLVRAVVNTIPMGNVRERELVVRFASVARATLKGTLVVAIVQGTIGGLLFSFVGIPAALLWGVAMTFLALLPVGGSGLVWGPAAVILLIQGQTWQGVTVLVVGALIIGLVDNILRPILVGRDTQMPDYLVLLSTLGGITLFGLSGFILGPVVAALFITVWEIMGNEYGGKLS
ncbi:MAG: AI-2E family transporter [Bacteroidota bacterium]